MVIATLQQVNQLTRPFAALLMSANRCTRKLAEIDLLSLLILSGRQGSRKTSSMQRFYKILRAEDDSDSIDAYRLRWPDSRPLVTLSLTQIQRYNHFLPVQARSPSLTQNVAISDTYRKEPKWSRVRLVQGLFVDIAK
jgi:hypothetical protein